MTPIDSQSSPSVFTGRRCAAALLAELACAAAFAAPPTYRIVALQSPAGAYFTRATAVNNLGMATGYVAPQTPPTPYAALTWASEGAAPVQLTDLTPGNSADSSAGNAINDLGTVAGYATRPVGIQGASVWVNGNPAVQLDRLDTLSGKTKSVANGVNKGGTIVGTLLRSLSNQTPFPAYWTPEGAIHQLGARYGEAKGINDAGFIVGSQVSAVDGLLHGFIRSPDGGKHDLAELAGGFDGSQAVGINQHNEVAGTCEGEINGKTALRACMWRASGEVVDLGTLPGNWIEYQSIAIGDDSQVIGTYLDNRVTGGVFLWTAESGMRPLIDLVDPADPLIAYLQRGFGVEGISGNGIIAGSMAPIPPNVNEQAMLLVPMASIASARP